jgi:Tfp pilus assembly major pilin PilA
MRIITDDRAVSESVGFVLLAFIIMLGISTVLMIGYPIYQNSIIEGHIQNMENGFNLLSANANKVALYESPTQSSELKIYDGTLSLEQDGYINITYTYGANDDDYAYNSLPIMRYTINNNNVAYILGGVCKKDGNSQSIMLNSPLSYQYTSGTTPTIVFPLIEFTNNYGSIAGRGLTRVSISSPYYSKLIGTQNYDNSIRVDDVKNVTIYMRSNYTHSFSKYFHDNLGFTELENKNNTLIMNKDCWSDPITLYIVRCKIAINIE